MKRFKKSIKRRGNPSKYMPHHGKQEIARRKRQRENRRKNEIQTY